jgi:hypothetical protein
MNIQRKHRGGEEHVQELQVYQNNESVLEGVVISIQN